MNLSYPPLRIHIWGGLGSQLYGWAVFLDLRERFPRRDFVLVFHNAGVTKREPEIIEFINGCEFEILADFNELNQHTSLKSVIQRSFVVFGSASRVIPRFLGLIANANNDTEFQRIRPWVTSLRGHYSNRSIELSVVGEISEKLFGGTDLADLHVDSNVVGVHFRLGDLVNLGSKMPIDADRILGGVLDALSNSSLERTILICSDSPELALSRLSEVSTKLQMKSVSLSPRASILLLITSSIFIGSPSKISEWVAIFRSHKFLAAQTWLPVEMQSQIKRILGRETTINFF